MSGFPYLTLAILLPAGAAVVIGLLPPSLQRWSQPLAFLAALADLVVIAVMTADFKVGVAGFQFASFHPWISDFGISWDLGVDGISLFLVVLTGLLFPVALAGGSERRRTRSFVCWMLVLETACLGSFVSLDLFLFFVFFELTLVPAYFVIGRWGYSGAGPAAVKFFLYTFLGSAFLLVGIVAVAFLHQAATGVLTFDLTTLAQGPALSSTTQVVLFLAFTAAFAVKAPLFPFHTWSPDAYAEAPTGGVVVIAGVMAKLGSYGIIRFDFELFPKAVIRLSPLLLALCVIGILYGAVVACRQRDLKRMIAYSSLSHLGFIILGFFALTSQGLTGGVLDMSNHGLYTAGLFLLVGMVYRRWRTWQTDELSGLQRAVPVLAGAFTVMMMAAIGLPGLNGFIGEFLILVGTFLTHRWWAVAAAAGVIVAAVYLLWAYQQVFHGRPAAVAHAGPGATEARVRDLTWAERAVLLPLIALVVFIGIYPRPLLDRITPSVNSLIAHVSVETGYQQPPVASAGTGLVGAVLGGK